MCAWCRHTRGFQRVTHTTHHSNTTTTPHRDRHRERQRQREKRRRKRRRQENRRQDKRREKIHFQCGGAWPFFIDGVLCLVKPVNAHSLACQTVSSTIHLSFLSANLGRSTVFNFCELFILCSYSFHFLVMQLQFRNFPNYLATFLNSRFASVCCVSIVFLYVGTGRCGNRLTSQGVSCCF